MTTLDYSYYYYLQGTGPLLTYPSGHPNEGALVASNNPDLMDTEDGVADGVVAVGDKIRTGNWNAGTEADPIYFAGYSSSGDPIVEWGGAYYLFSNDGSIGAGLDVGFTTSGGPLQLCFVSGTSILTENGAQTVETLAIGDMVKTQNGNPVPIKWIGRQTVSTLFGPAERLMPVRFAKGSLGDGLPHAVLTVTADHAMLVDGILVHAGALVNGSIITRVPLTEMGETYTVYHIETEEHEIILANGAPAETFIDNVSRKVFDNYDEFEALYGDVPEMEELDYPRAMSARQVPSSIKDKLGIRRVA